MKRTSKQLSLAGLCVMLLLHGALVLAMAVPHDVNGDGRADVVWRNMNNGATHVWQMTSSGTRGPVTFPGGLLLNWVIQDVADVNGDGRADVVWRNVNNGATHVWLMTASGTRGPVTFPGGLPTHWQIQDVADVNGDGRADVVWRNTNNGATHVWLMTAGALRGSVTFPGGLPTNWQIQAVADVNGDGRADVVWRNTTNGATHVWLMTANGTRGSVTFPGGLPTNWQIQAVGDVNGDGRADFVWRNVNNGVMHVWQMTANGTRGPVTFPGGLPLNWVIQAVADVNGDGRADLIWRNVNNGATHVWQMTAGATRGPVTFPGGLPLNWELQGANSLIVPNTGRENFFACNIVAADNLFQAELIADTTDQEANFFRALSRLLRMVEETQNGPDASVFTDSLKEMLDRFGFSSQGRSICDLFTRPPKDANGAVVLPGNSPMGEEVQTFLETVALPAVMASIQENLQVIGPSFKLNLNSAEVDSIGLKDEGPVEIDFGDVKLLEALLLDLKGAMQISLAYDLNVDVDQIVNLGDALPIQQNVVDVNPGLLTLQPNHSALLGQARIALSQVVDSYNAASAFIRAETDNQDDDFFTIHPNDLQDEAELRTKLNQAQTSLSGQSFIDTELVNLKLFFDTPFDLRGLLPTIGFNPNRDPANFIGSNTFPDPSFNGILPNMTQERLTDILNLEP